MKIRNIHIQHYKSLSDVKFPFSNVNVLVGQNATGKSNIIDVLRFLKDAYVYDLDHAITDRGGMEILRQYSPTRPYTLSIRIDFTYDLPDIGPNLPGIYSLKLSSARGTYAVEHEYAEWSFWDVKVQSTKVERYLSKYIYERGPDGFASLNDKKIETSLSKDQLGIKTIRVARYVFDDVFAGMRFASIFPNTLRDLVRPDQDRRLKEDCSNWASVIKAMRQRKQDIALQRVMSYMSKVIPGLQNVTVKTAGSYLVPQFLVQNKPESKAHHYDPAQLSDGTLRLFGMLLTMYQVPQPSFIAMEEPEQMLHPGVLHLLVDAIRETSTRCQVLITTHSPYLLDLFKPEEIKVVYMESGETRVAPIKESQIKIVQDGLMRVSEIMALDGLLPGEQ